jgi:hypothetical protein
MACGAIDLVKCWTFKINGYNFNKLGAMLIPKSGYTKYYGYTNFDNINRQIL